MSFNNHFGSSFWSTSAGTLNNQEILNLSSGVFFGRSLYGFLGWLIANAMRHLISIASSRSGKGVSQIIPNLLLYLGGVVVVDPKGENTFITISRRREMGQDTHVLDPFNEVNRVYGSKTGEIEKITTFNPLSILKPKDKNYTDDLDYLAHALIMNQGKDRHWDDSARELVAGLIAWLVETLGVGATLPKVRSILAMGLEKIVEIAVMAQSLDDNSPAKLKLGRFASAQVTNDNRELQSIISTAVTQTAFLDSSALRKSLSSTTPGFSFDCLVEGKRGASIYLVLPADKLERYGRWLRLMVSIAIRTHARNTRLLEHPTMFFLDEFGTIGHLPALSQAYSLMAGFQMRLWVFVQDIGQLQRDYPDDWDVFVNNSDFLTFFGILGQNSAEYASKLIGLATGEKISMRTQMIRTGGFGGFGVPFYTDMSDQLFPRDLIQPAEIRRLSEAYGIIISRGAPVLYERVKYYEDPFFAALARPNPYYSSRTTANWPAPVTDMGYIGPLV